MDEIEIDSAFAIKLGWAIIWRTVLVSFIAAIAVGMVVGLVGAVAGLPKSVVGLTSMLAGLVLWFVVYFWAVLHCLQKPYGNHRLRLMKHNQHTSFPAY